MGIVLLTRARRTAALGRRKHRQKYYLSFHRTNNNAPFIHAQSNFRAHRHLDNVTGTYPFICTSHNAAHGRQERRCRGAGACVCCPASDQCDCAGHCAVLRLHQRARARRVPVRLRSVRMQRIGIFVRLIAINNHGLASKYHARAYLVGQRMSKTR